MNDAERREAAAVIARGAEIEAANLAAAAEEVASVSATLARIGDELREIRRYLATISASMGATFSGRRF